mgnify:CR=1 FL=1
MDSSTRAALLEGSPLGGLGVGAEALTALFVERKAPAHAAVFSEGELGGAFFVVGSGRLRAFRMLPNGHEITVFLLGPGESFGFLPLLDGGPYPVSVHAMEPSTLLLLERTPFLKLLRTNAELGVRLLEHLASRLRGCMDQLSALGLPGAYARAANGLLSLGVPAEGAPDEATVQLPFSQEELARVLHVTPENLSRALAKLRRARLLEKLGPGRFRVPSIRGLRQAAQGD